MTPEQLAAIRERVEKASPGPWTSDKDFENTEEMQIEAIKGPEMYAYDEGGLSDDDAHFIAHARQDIPALLAYVEELESVIRSAYESPSSDEAQSILSVYASPR